MQQAFPAPAHQVEFAGTGAAVSRRMRQPAAITVDPQDPDVEFAPAAMDRLRN